MTPEEHIEQCVGIGFAWRGRKGCVRGSKSNEKREKRFSELKEYKDEHEHCNVPQRSGGKV